MKDGLRDAAQKRRLHGTPAAGAKHDRLGAQTRRYGKDVGGDLLLSVDYPRLRVESGGHGSLRAVVGGVERDFSSAASVPSSA